MASDLDDLYHDADFITVHMPVTEMTRGMLNATAFARMKPGVRIVNCARGEIIAEADLLSALDAGQVAAAALPLEIHVVLRVGQSLAADHAEAGARPGARRLRPLEHQDQPLQGQPTRVLSHVRSGRGGRRPARGRLRGPRRPIACGVRGRSRGCGLEASRLPPGLLVARRPLGARP